LIKHEHLLTADKAAFEMSDAAFFLKNAAILVRREYQIGFIMETAIALRTEI